MTTAFTLISGISPDIRKFSYLASLNNLNYTPIKSEVVDYSMFSDEIDCVKQNTYFLGLNDSNLIKNVLDYLQIENVNQDVQKNTIKVIDSLSKLFTQNIKEENVYTSNYGTVLIDFEKGSSIFSLEIGVKSIGYFSEIDSITNNFCEESVINDEQSFDLSIGKLNNDFVDFYNRI